MKKIFITVLALSILSVISPVIAAPKKKTLFTAEASFVAGNVSMGEQKISEDGILNVKGAISEGTVTGISGPDISGSLWTRLNGDGDLNTGEGSFHGKWTITMIGGTFEGSVVGVVTATGPTTGHISGTFIGFGTGDYSEQKMKGSFEGNVIMGILQVELGIEGILTSKRAGADGVNEHGVSVTFNGDGIFGVPSKQRGFQSSMITRSILDGCRSVDDAAELIRTTLSSGFFNLLVVDKNSNAALLEFADGTSDTKRINNDSANKCLVSTNHYTLPATVKFNEYNCARVCDHYYSDSLGTLWSSIFDLTSAKADICFGAPTHNEWR